MGSQVGKLLIASPKLKGGSFERTVVFVLQDDANGTFGVVLNRPASNQMRDIWNEITSKWDARGDRLSFGGPMSGPILAIHRIEELGELHPSENIFAAATQANLKQLVSREDEPYRIFFGFSAWKPEQLENEIQQGVWLPLPASENHVFNQNDELWGDALREFGCRTIARIIGKNQVLQDPTLN